jgi:hypothetical protein
LVNPVTVVVGDDAVVMVGTLGPVFRYQFPVPEVIAFPASVAVVTEQIVWSGPAFAVVGGAVTLICTLAELLAHALLLMVHLKV